SDQFSQQLDSLLSQVAKEDRISKSKKAQMQQVYRKRYSYSGVGRNYSGYVTTIEDGSRLPGVNVVIKGTTYGTVTDIDGYYSLYGPHDATLVFSFIGLTSQEVETGSRNIIDVQMSPDVAQLSEVVVTAMGVSSRKKALGYSTTTSNVLQSTVAGVSITGAAGKIIIRGNTSIESAHQPLIIVDGKIYKGEYDTLPKGNVQVLKGESAVSIYGSRAVGGVIIITTENSTNNPDDLAQNITAKENSIRSNFRDYAFWQPQLKTNRKGNASISITLPDDITSWEANILAYAKSRRTGQKTVKIRSYLPVSGRLQSPRFLTQEDSVYILGKTSNYTGIDQQVRYAFYQGDQLLKSGNHDLQNVEVDSLLVTAGQVNDTLQMIYHIETENGFSDGEKREIPIQPKGIAIETGYFWPLSTDTTLTVHFADSLGPVNIYATANFKDVFKDELIDLINYEYGCNEQLASRLIAIGLYQNHIDSTKYQRQAKRLKAKLQSRQANSGFWSWWSEHSPSYWVTEHILTAFTVKQAWKNELPNYDLITETALWELNKKIPADEKLKLININRLLNPNFEAQPYLNDLKADTATLSVFDKFKIWQIESEDGMAIPVDSLLKYGKYDVYGNLYFKHPEQQDLAMPFYRSDLQLSLIAYKILKYQNEHKLADKVFNYFLMERTNGNWPNTYESSEILLALSDRLKDLEYTNVQLQLSGIIESDVRDFPFIIKNVDPGQLRINKMGTNPMYISAFQSINIESPVSKNKYFEINTSFGKDSVHLTAGEIYNLTVQLTARKAGDFIVLDVPIPAGFSYIDKNKSGREAHREYHRDKVSLFFEHLPAGSYEFTISIMPKFKGTFTQNPAKAHLMYHPTINGWNETKQIVVE
ncbi:MAG: carboxypeptidase-like regulatory domain-containing protein, partial [Fulvivirga sp.]|nr:carboxypeptidase-like regulatory domain-containing protein [Fulvivirga sp.]